MILDLNKKQFLKKNIPVVAFLAGLCCFTPIVLVLFGLSTVAFAASLADTLYGTYKWVFRGVGIVLLLASLSWYFYKKEGVCSLDAVKRKKTQIINFTLLTLSIAVIAYLVWLHVIVHLFGVILGIWA